MADISSKLDKIKSAERGEDVRDAIIGALRDINNDVPADMSNPERVTADMPGNSDLTIPFNPPKLVSEIYVRQAGSGGKSTTLKDITITENGEYPTDEEDYDSSTENRYYKKVKVDVPQLANKIEMDEVVIEQNGTYSATEWGVDGLRTITVNVQAASGDGPFTVEFYDSTKTTVIHTELVPKGGKASCTIYDGTTYNGQYFTGWNPAPSNVTRDMKCYPQFGDVVIDPNEIQDSWETICAKRGAGYPLGSYKALVVNVPARTSNGTFTWNTVNAGPRYSANTINQSAINIAMHMVKVAEGEDGTTSTWLSTGVIPVFPTWDNGEGGMHVGSAGSDGPTALVHRTKLDPDDQGFDNNVYTDWIDNPRREYLNNYLIENIPECLGQTIKSVNKVTGTYNLLPYYLAFPSDTPSMTRIYKPSTEKIWVPSYKELYSYMATRGHHDEFDGYAEPTGIDYTAVYMPTYPTNSILTRTVFRTRPHQIFEVSFNEYNDMNPAVSSPGCPIGFCL